MKYFQQSTGSKITKKCCASKKLPLYLILLLLRIEAIRKPDAEPQDRNVDLPFNGDRKPISNPV